MDLVSFDLYRHLGDIIFNFYPFRYGYDPHAGRDLP